MLGPLLALGGSCGGSTPTRHPTTGFGGLPGFGGTPLGGMGGLPGGVGGAGGASGAGGGTPTAHQDTGQSWTVLIYMAADNNLEPFALEDLQEMAQVGSTDKLHIVVQIDRSAGYVNDPAVNLPAFSGGRRLLVHRGSLEVLQTLGPIDSGSPTTLAQFITWGVTQYPADRTALILWDHGGGWAGYGQDETSRSLITAPALRTAIAQGLTGASLPRLALVAFDACLMATFEIASMLRPYAEYLLASEETIPGHGFDYGQLVAAADDPTIAPPALVNRMINGYLAQSQAQNDEASLTISLTDLYLLDPVQTAIGALATASGMPLPAARATTIGRARQTAREYGDQGQTPGVMVDVVDLAARLAAADPTYASAALAIRTAVSQAVVLEAHGASRAGSNGLSVYFPFQLRDEDPAFEQIMEVASWRRFLDAYLTFANGGAISAPSFVSPDGTAVTQIVGGNLVVSGAITAGSAAVIDKAMLLYGVVATTGQTLYVLGNTPASYNATLVQGSWDLNVLRLDQGTVSNYGFLNAEAAPDGSVSLTIPFVYNQGGGAADQSAFRALVFDPAANLIQDTYYLDTGGVFGPLTAVLGSTLTPTILVADQTGAAQWLKAGPPFDASLAIDPGVEPVGSGAIVFGELVIENIQEESSFVVGTEIAP